MNWLKRLLGIGAKPESKNYTTRLGKVVETDEAFEAWTSGELSKMMQAAKRKTNPIDRHFLLMTIVGETYKRRSDESARYTCAEYAEKHLEELPSIIPALKKEMGGTLPRITTFQHYATLLAEMGEFERAIAVCRQAIGYGLHDNTKSGYEGRIARIKKQAEKSP